MTCNECERIRRYMAADPEMYRGEDRRCAAHRQAAELAEAVDKFFVWWDSLPGPAHFSIPEIQKWLNKCEGPIKALRTARERK